MSSRIFTPRNSRLRLIAVGMLTAMFALSPMAWAGHRSFRNQSVGGISIDPAGVLRNADLAAAKMNFADLRKNIKAAPGVMGQPVQQRMVSLKGLEAAIAHARNNNLGQLPDELNFLGGLQKIEMVLVYPEENDIFLVGPGEGWRVDNNANVVGITTGLPVLRLDDLLVAFRTVNAAREEGITCSINPTKEGIQAMQTFVKKQKRFTPGAVAGIEKTLGQQKITLTGVPSNSHFARVLVASDYHMKRMAMDLDPTPVKEIPGFLTMYKNKGRRLKNMMPRWWLACNYEPMTRSEDGLSWKLNGPGVKAMTEDDFVDQDGNVKATGKQNPLALQWAKNMTEHYSELSQKNAVFGELRNLMDMCVVAALIEKEGLMAKAGCSIPLMTDPESELGLDEWNAPKSVSTQCSVIKKGKNYIITASGGVEIDSWSVVDNSVVDAKLDAIRDSLSQPSGETWWVNN